MITILLYVRNKEKLKRYWLVPDQIDDLFQLIEKILKLYNYPLTQNEEFLQTQSCKALVSWNFKKILLNLWQAIHNRFKR